MNKKQMTAEKSKPLFIGGAEERSNDLACCEVVVSNPLVFMRISLSPL
jgi:hypothetical protein